LKNPLKRQRKQQENFTCKNCGYTFPREGANISGWKDEKTAETTYAAQTAAQ
jgi:transposase-like protein